MPALAAMPERGARMPILTGPDWAMAGANTPCGSASALALAMDFNTVRREIVMACSLVVRLIRMPRERQPAAACGSAFPARELTAFCRAAACRPAVPYNPSGAF